MSNATGKKVLFLWAGDENFHSPKAFAEVLGAELAAKGCQVRIESSFAPLADLEAMQALDLIVPAWTMGDLPTEQWVNLSKSVNSGVGVGGIHGGLGDAFRKNLSYQWMVGGQFVSHPYVGSYKVRLTKNRSPITDGMPEQFEYSSEQYYMMVDPGVTVLADTVISYNGQDVVMPTVWTKKWGQGRVFYSALGHAAEEFKTYPNVLAMTVRGLLWAAEGKAALARG